MPYCTCDWYDTSSFTAANWWLSDKHDLNHANALPLFYWWRCSAGDTDTYILVLLFAVCQTVYCLFCTLNLFLFFERFCIYWMICTIGRTTRWRRVSYFFWWRWRSQVNFFPPAKPVGMGRKSTRGRRFYRCDGVEMQQVFPDRLLEVCRRVWKCDVCSDCGKEAGEEVCDSG